MSWPHVLTLWSFEPTVLAGIALAALLYLRGRRPLTVVVPARGPRRGPWHTAGFFAGLLVVVLALESPIDTLSASLFSFHMLQHLLLIMVAAPLLLLGDPAVTLMRGVPLSLRRAVLGAVTRRAPAQRLSSWLRWTRSPVAAFAIFNLDLYFWHWHVMFNLTLQNDAVHITEHLCFLITALLLWSQVIDQRAVHVRLPYIWRSLYLLITAAAGNALAMYFVFAPHAVYSAYARLTPRPYGLSPLSDQQIAGASMWVPVLFIFAGAALLFLYKALSDEERRTVTVPAPNYTLSFSPGENVAGGSTIQ